MLDHPISQRTIIVTLCHLLPYSLESFEFTDATFSSMVSLLSVLVLILTFVYTLTTPVLCSIVCTFPIVAMTSSQEPSVSELLILLE